MTHLNGGAGRKTGIALLGVALMAATARGDGCMFAVKEVGQSQKMVASHRQEAAIATDGQTVRVTLRTHFRAGPEELAWIVPVPAKPDTVECGNDALFADLDRETAPRFYRNEYHGGGFSCGCAASQNAVVMSEATVRVEASGAAGIFKYEVLAATDAKDLVDWLTKNHYAVPPRAAAVFGPYVQAGWHWLAMRVRPEATGQKDLAPHPVVYTYRDAELKYPLTISQLSADAESEIILYVLGPARYACTNWKNATSEELAGPFDRRQFQADLTSPSGTNYESLLREASRRSDHRLFVTEFADDYRTSQAPSVGLRGNSPGLKEKAVYLTRLRAVMPPTSMDRDVLLVPVTWQSVSPRLQVAAVGDMSRLGGPAVSMGATGLLCAGLLLPRRRWGRAAAVGCLTAACLAFAMI